MPKKSNKDLRESSSSTVEYTKQRKFLIDEGVDESLAEDFTRSKKRRKPKAKESTNGN